jgi:hypothetical protein
MAEIVFLMMVVIHANIFESQTFLLFDVCLDDDQKVIVKIELASIKIQSSAH